MEHLEQIILAPSLFEVLRHFGATSASMKLALAGQAGSGRKYYRIHFGKQTWILQQSHSADADFDRFVDYCNLFASLNLNTPRIHAVDHQVWQVLLDDLGTTQLWDHCRAMDPVHSAYPDAAYSKDLYHRVLTALTHWQTASDLAFAANAELANRDFDTHALRWETGYFTEHYLQGHCGLSENDVAPYQPLFDQLAERVSAQPRGLMHRDFQSQNVMVDAHGRIGFVDFQGARHGSLYYDVASLLWDPYVSLDAKLVQEWFMQWVSENPNLRKEPLHHWTLFLEASLQRLMQAMGAYCNLSRNKGVASFAAHIEPGKKRLLAALKAYHQVPGHLDLSPLEGWLR